MGKFHLTRKDICADSLIEIATYQISENRFVVCKNEKQIGWASTRQSALRIHEMYMRLHTLHENHSDSNACFRIMEMRAKTQDNGFLHNFPDEVLEEKKKRFEKFLSSYVLLSTGSISDVDI